ncbi:SDR family NAD(P)-dependent oxidoreductase, partial [Paenibacillus xylanexedens]|uniref:SDR family NAD(P)-dependent oxidoreductase n=1 Tax=Paenibacillus xylanexedens TaxID=528191 RepID=UPI0034D953CA
MSVALFTDTFKLRTNHLHILINNPPIATFRTFLDIHPQHSQPIFHLNLIPTYYLTPPLLPTIINQTTPTIINIPSTAPHRPFPTGS